jgi:hypothetical protein
MDFPPIPNVWHGVIPRPKLTFGDLQGALDSDDCKVQVERLPWTYTTFRQRLWNGIRVFVIGEGIERSTSIGTEVRATFYCYQDGNQGDTRIVPVSLTETLTDDCVYTRVEVRQKQVQVERSWARWTLSMYFEDDTTSVNVENAVSMILDVAGLLISGPAQVAYGVVDAGMSITGWDLNGDYQYVSRDHAGPETVWDDVGPPSGYVVDGPTQLPLEECNERTDLREAGSEGLTTSVE